MIGQLGSPPSFCLEERQGALVQDLPARLAELGVDHIAHQLMREAIAARAAPPCFSLAQHPAADGLLQGLDTGLHSHISHLPQQLRARLGAQHGTGHHELACWLRQLCQARLDHHPH